MDYALGDEDALKDFYNTEPKSRRGRKFCPECGADLAAANRNCECGHTFYIAKKTRKSKRFKEIDWKELVKGDTIFLEGGDRWESPEGESVPMGHTGEFEVQKVTSQGLLLKNKYGYCFQDMINFGLSKVTGILREKPTIYRK